MADEPSENKAAKATSPPLLIAGCPKPINALPHIVSPVFAIKEFWVKIPEPPYR